MGFPDTDWPTSVDAEQDRTDASDIIWANDFDFQDRQVRQIQTWLGTTGQLIGAGVAGAGVGGLMSPVASGSEAFRLSARNAFAAGTLLTLGDDSDNVYQEKFRVNYAGLLWTGGGGDFSSGILDIPTGASLPGAGSVGRMFYKTGADEGLYSYGSSGWALAGGGIGSGSFLEMGIDYSYSQGATPVEEVVGQGVFTGSYVAPGSCFFRAIATPTFGVAGSATLKLYDLGPKAGPPEAPRNVANIATSTDGGPQFIEQELTVVGAAPTSNEILDTARMYEITVIQTSQEDDSVYVGSTGLEVR